MTETRVSDAVLDSYVGQNIARFCPYGFTEEAHSNHCAHWVAHLLGLTMGYKCNPQGVSVRVNEIYNRCTDRGAWDQKPTPLIYCLIFATQPSNMAADGRMLTSTHKHMGIWSFPYVYNYSTMARQVLKELVPDFQARLEGVYDSAGTNPVQLFYGRNIL